MTDSPKIYSDAARRCADIINQFVSTMSWDEVKHKWVAIRLSDGGFDGTLYDSKRDAVRHQTDEFKCAYIAFRNLPMGATAKEAEIFLDYNRRAYDAGFRLPDPDHVTGGPDLFLPTEQYDNLRAQHVKFDVQRIIAQAFGKRN